MEVKSIAFPGGAHERQRRSAEGPPLRAGTDMIMGELLVVVHPSAPPPGSHKHTSAWRAGRGMEEPQTHSKHHFVIKLSSSRRRKTDGQQRSRQKAAEGRSKMQRDGRRGRF